MLTSSLKIAFRALLRHKFYTFISLFAICFTLVVLNVCTAMFDATFGPMAPEKKSDRTLGIYGAQLRGEQARRTGYAGYALLDTYARDLPGVELMSISTFASPVYSYPNGERVEMYLKRTDGAFWQILDFDFLEGGPFTAEDDRAGNRVAVINDATRKRLFGDTPAVGRSLEADGQTFRVVGVVKNVPILRVAPFADVWVPLGTAASDGYKKELVGYCVGLLLARSPADFPAIREEFASRIQHADLSGERYFTEVSAAPATLLEFGSSTMLMDRSNGRGNPGLLIAVLVILMTLFMLLPTINLTNINVSRIMERAPEIGVRKAFGASSATLVGQFLVENVAITLAGAMLAFGLTQLVLSMLNSSGVIAYAALTVNYRVFLYGVAIAGFFGLMSGVYPAWKMSRMNPVAALKGGH